MVLDCVFLDRHWVWTVWVSEYFAWEGRKEVDGFCGVWPGVGLQLLSDPTHLKGTTRMEKRHVVEGYSLSASVISGIGARKKRTMRRATKQATPRYTHWTFLRPWASSTVEAKKTRVARRGATKEPTPWTAWARLRRISEYLGGPQMDRNLGGTLSAVVSSHVSICHLDGSDARRTE